MTFQKGGFVMGLVAGLLVGLALALGVALYITKAPVPFVNKVPQRTAEHDKAETERNRDWDPNAALAGKAGARATNAASAASAAAGPGGPGPGIQSAPQAAPVPVAPAASAPVKPARDPAAILAGEPASAAKPTVVVPEPFVFFVQAGAFTRNEDAEQQRAKLAIIGQSAKITEREQAGRVVYRVRMGPFPLRNEADTLQAKLQEQGIESQIVRVEKP